MIFIVVFALHFWPDLANSVIVYVCTVTLYLSIFVSYDFFAFYVHGFFGGIVILKVDHK